MVEGRHVLPLAVSFAKWQVLQSCIRLSDIPFLSNSIREQTRQRYERPVVPGKSRNRKSASYYRPARHSVYWQGSDPDFGLELQTMANYKKSTTPDLLRIFAKAAAEQGEALFNADPKRADSRYRTMMKTYSELKSRG